MKLGIDRLAHEPGVAEPLRGHRVAVLCNPASITSDLRHSIDAIAALDAVQLTAAFGPQHGIRGDKQDNMVETEDTFDDALGIPIFSLYGTVRRPTDAMLDTFDILLVDLQDVGTRIYTFLTTLLYVLEAAEAQDKAVWVLDRPNPAGRAVEGTLLQPGYESFVGASILPMRHGMTLGEAAKFFVDQHKLDVELHVVEMHGYEPTQGPGYGWPVGHLPWVNPSPNAASLNMVRCYPGTVLLEGVTLSEGRGTTLPLEVVGAPDIDRDAIVQEMRRIAPRWLRGAWIRPFAFEPTFHKHMGSLCHGIQIHADYNDFDPQTFQPYRLINAFLKALRTVHPDYDLWRDHPYEYTKGRLPIDVIDGGPMLREWVDDPAATVQAREERLAEDEAAWVGIRAGYLFY